MKQQLNLHRAATGGLWRVNSSRQVEGKTRILSATESAISLPFLIPLWILPALTQATKNAEVRISTDRTLEENLYFRLEEWDRGAQRVAAKALTPKTLGERRISSLIRGVMVSRVWVNISPAFFFLSVLPPDARSQCWVRGGGVNKATDFWWEN